MGKRDDEELAEWNPDKIVESMAWETRLDGPSDEAVDYKATAERVIKENAPYAAAVMRHLALYSQNEKQRFEAAKYILDQTIGRPSNDPIVTEENDPLATLTGKFIQEAEVFANSASNASNTDGDSGNTDPPKSDD